MSLARPPVNALDGPAYDELRLIFTEASPDDVVVVRGLGPHFSAGQDVAELRTASRGQRPAVVRRGAAAIVAALRCRGTVVTAVHGGAVGAGCLLACAADVLLLADDAWLSLPELQVGTSIGYSVATRVLPPALVRRMLLTGERVPASVVASAGGALLVPGAELAATADRVADQIAALDPGVLARARVWWDGNGREDAAHAYTVEVDADLHVGARQLPGGEVDEVQGDADSSGDDSAQ